uniref:Uncharacterized protein n=1 Tax=CrAss-like virus sp. ctYsL76 TaxID=2826826 RepID=A0A8S5QMG6_9CAUD|nr:MAG TPA: hypothetical protein [CrAss-like virus sp. ctYsL76]
MEIFFKLTIFPFIYNVDGYALINSFPNSPVNL